MKPILISTAVAGTLDLALAITFFAIKGVPLEGVPHAVAAGLLGVRAFRLGLPTAILGVALHYFIAFCVSAFYYFLSRRFGFLNNHPIASGAIYGIGVFLFMQHVVLPLSAEPRSHPPTPGSSPTSPRTSSSSESPSRSSRAASPHRRRRLPLDCLF